MYHLQLFILVVISTLSFFNTSFAEDAVFNNEQKCSNNSDCTMIDLCAEAYAINKNFSKKAHERFNKKGIVCISMIPSAFRTHVSKCKKSLCVLAKMADFSSASIDDCINTETEKERRTCFKTIAIQHNKPEYCSHHSISRNKRIEYEDYPYFQTNCEYNVFDKNKSTKSSERHCKVFVDNALRNNCFFKLAVETNDVLICGEISDGSGKSLNDCLRATRSKEIFRNNNSKTTIIALSKEECVALRPFFKKGSYSFQRCVMDSAIATNNEKTCNLLKARLIEQVNCIMNVAKSSKNASKCAALKNLPPVKKPWDSLNFANCIKWAN